MSNQTKSKQLKAQQIKQEVAITNYQKELGYGA